ncbi:MAG: hypothetical protein Q3998_01440 [Porphyromonas sp.]|nr:hypothetical protein [Porphyromonas sp.]
MKKYIQIGFIAFLLSVVFPTNAQNGSTQKAITGKSPFLEKIDRALYNIYMGKPFLEFDPLPTVHNRRILTVGMGQVLDDYLSPIPQEGLFLRHRRLGYERERREMWQIQAWQSLMDIHVGLYRNPINGSGMQYLLFDGSFGPAWSLLQKSWLKWNVALLGNLSLGSTIKSSNTNNVFNLKLSTGFDLSTDLLFPVKIKEYKMFFHYRAQISALHLTFHPGYGQPYYDYIGGENGAPLKFYLTQPWNRLKMNQMFAVDIPFARSTMMLGFEHGYTNMDLNGRKFRELYLGLALGYSFDSFKLSGSRSIRNNRIDKSFHF